MSNLLSLFIVFLPILFPAEPDPLIFDLSKAHDMEVSSTDLHTYDITTTGADPYIFAQPLTADLDENASMVSFEYFCPTGLDFFELYFYPLKEDPHPIIIKDIGSTEGWVKFTIDISAVRSYWGKSGDILRMDFGGAAGLNIQVRAMEIRAMTAREKEILSNKEAIKQQEAIYEKGLQEYLGRDYEAGIHQVSVGESSVDIEGDLGQSQGQYALAEVPVYANATEAQELVIVQEFNTKNKGTFSSSIDRFIERDGYRYDRLLSKWLVVKKTEEGFRPASHARHPDAIVSKYDYDFVRPSTIKGIGGYSAGREAPTSDLDDLGITSVTINIWLNKFYRSSAAPGHLEHEYMGKTYYIDQKSIEGYDRSFKEAADRNIEVSAIILVDKASGSPDKTIGEILQHPDCDPAGIYSMPNVTSAEGVQYYAAVIDFLADRYMRQDKKYGRINHWIVHNEVDAGWVWTNAGDKSALVFLDLYHKSMRIINNIAKSYNPNSKVFITLTHYWNWTSNPHFYLSKDLLEYLLQFSRAEGDFDWGIAQHPYPESLREPKTWLDNKVSFNYETPLITFKNIEVLNAWVQLPEVRYKGTEKRLLYLSENGTNSPTYSEKDLHEQAAGMAYAMKKIKYLEGIDGFQYHNWQDNRREGGLRIGLRRFPDDEEDPSGKKPVWEVYRAFGQEDEDLVYDPYLKTIGIESWDEVRYKEPIYGKNLSLKSKREVMSDTWVATDHLGRTLPSASQTGPLKQDRTVGMFYFINHDTPAKTGPYNVTEILQENPKNPNWGPGAHFWGEPEIGYYLNNEEWAIRKHAYQLMDAGVDVIIMDVTNDRTYRETYLTLCKVYTEMRAIGEKTPDIAFLASEKSVNKLWEDFYSQGLYQDLWFYWNDKPLLLYGQHEIPSRNKVNDIVFSSTIREFFTLKQSWAWTTLPWYEEGQDEWPWVDHFPQAISWSKDPSEAEMIPVSAAQHPLSNIGRSYHNFHQPELDDQDLTAFTDEGLYFQEQWNRAIEVEPKFVFVTGWNEWSAGKKVMEENVSEELQQWNFYPGAHLGKGGKPIQPGEAYFIDQYNQEFSRDIEPMKGGHGDNYYYQLMANIRKYKGSRKVPSATSYSINILGDFDQWDAVSTEYYDHIGDTMHRNSIASGTVGPYIDESGRNDFESSKICYDKDKVYFLVQTLQPIKVSKGGKLSLLINIDRDSDTGLAGYDLAVDLDHYGKNTSTLQAFQKDKGWKKLNSLEVQLKGNQLMLAIPIKYLRTSGGLDFEFHWVDAIEKLDCLEDILSAGDNAPSRRANYLFTLN
ncbi:hypothetical protein GCM10007049_06310 [Echinicola pacifica]|uniref:DUF5722 domain-containing protein n=1 Tax=Echinicola pacifica TaxID=346377 RepID=A0A918PPF7_9BACT|nr:DUF5722 domain-containing protein [Echinicola pacifica]GGZ16675.1 hypothetical protein GCM10007049_06310 [Echinicola pacifica]